MKRTDHIIFDKSGAVTVDLAKLFADPKVKQQIQAIEQIRQAQDRRVHRLLTRVCDWLPTDCPERQQLRNDIIEYIKGPHNGSDIQS